jgi:hypothetical protein
MKPHHYLAIAVRLFAVFLATYVIGTVVNTVQYILYDVGVPVGIMSIVAVTQLIFAIFLWFFPLTIAKGVIKPELDYEIEPLKTHSILVVLLLSLGVYLGFNAVVDAVYWISLEFMSPLRDTTINIQGLSEDSKANIIATAVELILAYAIIFKSRVIASALLGFAK